MERLGIGQHPRGGVVTAVVGWLAWAMPGVARSTWLAVALAIESCIRTGRLPPMSATPIRCRLVPGQQSRCIACNGIAISVQSVGADGLRLLRRTIATPVAGKAVRRASQHRQCPGARMAGDALEVIVDDSGRCESGLRAWRESR
jgi:hypothetical protein